MNIKDRRALLESQLDSPLTSDEEELVDRLAAAGVSLEMAEFLLPNMLHQEASEFLRLYRQNPVTSDKELLLMLGKVQPSLESVVQTEFNFDGVAGEN